MSKEKKVQPTEIKKEKEQYSILESIRKRTGLLVGIIGLALVIFILQSLLGSGASIFGGNEMNTIGFINGKKIDRENFNAKLENQLNLIRQQRQSNDIDDNTRGQVIDFVWNQFINDLVIKPQYDKVGITVGEDEVYDKVVANPVQSVIQQLSDQKTGQLNPQFARPDGSLDLAKWKQAVQSLPAEQEFALKQMEENVRMTRYAEKYASLIKKGLYTTTAEAKELFKTQNTKANISFVVKRFDAVSDSAIKVTDADLQKYYNDHTYEFSNPETIRKIEYVSFNVVPSVEDLAKIEKESKEAAAKFTGKTMAEDSAYIQQESENGAVTIQDFTKKTMIVRDSSIFTSPVGTVFGPYNEGAYFKIYKLEAVNSLADSCRVRHILIATNDPQTQQPKRTLEQAKKQADSLITLIKEKKVTFDTLVKTISDDGGSKDKGGDYGWFDDTKGFVEPFKNAGLMGTKGNISAVLTQFGYHIIEVLDVSKTRHDSYKVAQIFKLIAPSDETNQKIFATANEFSGKNNTAELFDKAVDAQRLTKRIADNIKEGERTIPGLDNPKELVKWVYTAKKGEVSVFSFNDKHVVAKLAAIKNKGTLPLEDVKEEVTLKTKQQKKAEQFLTEFKNAGTTVEQVSAKLGLELKKQESLTLISHNIEGLGHDDVIIGTVAGTKQGATSKALVGDNGVFIVAVNNKLEAPAPKDYNMQKTQNDQAIGGRSDYDVFNALKEKAEIEDHKSRIE
ncbi:MAG: SurA N-terminal domain-containing protein [Bacteroidota bacterium]|nr:SurA N-terminal domain-containing protein [Bacteroidota bacterium]